MIFCVSSHGKTNQMQLNAHLLTFNVTAQHADDLATPNAVCALPACSFLHLLLLSSVEPSLRYHVNWELRLQGNYRDHFGSSLWPA